MKNDDFQEGKMVADGRFLGAIRPKIAIFKEEKWVCSAAKFFKDFYGGDVDEMIDFERVKSPDL